MRVPCNFAFVGSSFVILHIARPCDLGPLITVKDEKCVARLMACASIWSSASTPELLRSLMGMNY